MSFNVLLVAIRTPHINARTKVSNVVDCVIYNFNLLEPFSQPLGHADNPQLVWHNHALSNARG